VKQADPISSIYFILTLNPLTQILRKQHHLRTHINESIQCTELLFADDTTLLAGMMDNLRPQLEIVNVYRRGSETQLNKDKCKAMNLNLRCTMYSSTTTVSAVQDTEIIKYLGKVYGKEITDYTRIQYIHIVFTQTMAQ